jgi:hypothetical protein
LNTVPALLLYVEHLIPTHAVGVQRKKSEFSTARGGLPQTDEAAAVVAEAVAEEEVVADTAVGAAARATIMTKGTQIANATLL